jgi:ribosomal protein S18 acetylase RimI-like enzyme
VTIYRIEPALRSDLPSIGVLLRDAAGISGGLVRAAGELSDDYIQHVVSRSLERGITLVARATDGSRLLGVVLAQFLGPRSLAHVLSELTLAVHSNSQGLGIGRSLMQGLIDTVTNQHPHILRVELLTRESNERARFLYGACGFREEGRFIGRIRNADGRLEADIPMAWTRAH